MNCPCGLVKHLSVVVTFITVTSIYLIMSLMLLGLDQIFNMKNVNDQLKLITETTDYLFDLCDVFLLEIHVKKMAKLAGLS